MSDLAAAGADEACHVEKRESAAWREPRSALSEIALRHHAFVLARIRLTRMAAERGPILSGACGQVGCFTNPGCQSDFRVRAPAVSTGSSVSGV
jgi:hypothetical protein